MSIKTGTLSRLKGLIWVVGGIAILAGAVTLAPMISHLDF
jgi:hypothetical protein